MSRQKSLSVDYDSSKLFIGIAIFVGVFIFSGITIFVLQNFISEVEYAQPTPVPSPPKVLNLPTPSPIPTLNPEQKQEVVEKLDFSFPSLPAEALNEILNGSPRTE